MVIKRYYEGRITDSLNHILFIGEENRVFQRIRESHRNNWKIIELCREILFYNAKEIKYITKEIENDRVTIKEFNNRLD